MSRAKILDCEYDVVLLDEKILIEFNGDHWHGDKPNLDEYKRSVAVRSGYRFIVVKSVRYSHGLFVNNYGGWVEITCFAEKRNKVAIDNMVCAVIGQVFSLLGLPVPDMSFVNSAKDESIITKLYNGEIILDTTKPIE